MTNVHNQVTKKQEKLLEQLLSVMYYETIVKKLHGIGSLDRFDFCRYESKDLGL